MDNIRAVLILSFFFVLTLLWQAWQRDYGQARPATLPSENTVAASPQFSSPTPTPEVPTTEAATPTPAGNAQSLVSVETDSLRVAIDLKGGELSKVLLRNYPVDVDHPGEPLPLLDNSDALMFVIQGGLLSDSEAPTHQDHYETAQYSYKLPPGSDSLEVPMVWRDASGHEVTKTFVFRRGSHALQVKYAVRNNGSAAWAGRLYGQLLRRVDKAGRALVPTYTGAAISSPEKRYEKLPFDEMSEDSLSRNITDGWAAVLQHYFVAAIIPDRAQPYHYYTKVLDGNRYIVGMYGPSTTVAPGATVEFSMLYYAGPKDQDTLESLAPGLDLTVDYGSLWFLAKPIFWLMQKLHAWTGNWGWTIVLLTLTVKLALYRLAAASYRSMAHMKRVQPRLLALRERYGNDRQRLNQAMMELYKEEKINPLGGCLPVVIQIPVFLALYWVLLESVELRQAPFLGWIKDLSTYDPYYVLPILMGVTMFLQQRMNPAPPDPMQAKVMQVLPIVFTIFFAFFPAGLVLYWLVNNILSIAQQWLITRTIEGAKAPS